MAADFLRCNHCATNVRLAALPQTPYQPFMVLGAKCVDWEKKLAVSSVILGAVVGCCCARSCLLLLQPYSSLSSQRVFYDVAFAHWVRLTFCFCFVSSKSLTTLKKFN